MNLGSRGRKSLAEEWITPDNLLLIEGLARDGKTNKDIAEKHIGINERTFANWIVKYNSINSALKKGRAPVAEKVEKSLYDLCQVQEYTDTVIEEYQDADGNVTSRHVRKSKRQVPPNPTAIIFALKNLKAEKWREKQVVSVNNQPETEPDNFLEALNGTAAADWEEEQDDETTGEDSSV